jgi:uncharacterized protein
MGVFALLFVTALALTGCESQRHLPAPHTPMRGAEAPGPTAVLPNGFTVRLELATNDELRGQGLMYRESLPSGEGMLFLFPQPGEYPFWMKNTLIPLDMIWLETSGRVVAIRPDVQPCRADPCPTYAPEAISSYVLELAAGEAKAHNLSVGDTIQLRNLGDVRPE